jgi:hypothetical protein
VTYWRTVSARAEKLSHERLFHNENASRAATTAGLHSYHRFCTILFGTFAVGRGAHKFLPIVLLGHELGFLIAKSRFECRGPRTRKAVNAREGIRARDMCHSAATRRKTQCLLENLLSQAVLPRF